ncbi:MAG: ATP-dependent zinc protease family protein [Opitutales bacterium]
MARHAPALRRSHTSRDAARQPEIIGWKEVISLPDWGIDGLIAKSDTGARGSAIDVRNLTVLSGDRVRFHVVLNRRDRENTREVVAPIASRVRIRSSNGQMQERYRVRTLLRIGHVEKEIELSLVSRRNMICRVLLGRRELSGDFLVDPEAKYRFGPRKRRHPATRNRTPATA